MDPSGDNVFVLSRCWLNDNNWILLYDEAQGNPSRPPYRLSDPNNHVADVRGPSEMIVSFDGKKLYLTSSARASKDSEEDDLLARVYCFSVEKTGPRVSNLTLQTVKTVLCKAPVSMAQQYRGMCVKGRYASKITSMAEDPITKCLYILGFTSPYFLENEVWKGIGSFSTPIMAEIAPEASEVNAIELPNPELVLPLSIVWTGQTGLSVTGYNGNSHGNSHQLLILAQHWLSEDNP